ncbi:hypothetical protein [Chromobacterium piscinae]|uniref:hypothetical protein n=1 Tax=Chromobacterium piscinae TaxID=686831 RepID=UPI003F810CD5
MQTLTQLADAVEEALASGTVQSSLDAIAALTNAVRQSATPRRLSQYGVDVGYFDRKLASVIPAMDNYKPDDLAREFARMAITADANAARAELSLATEQSGEAVNQQLLEATRAILAEDMLPLLPSEYVAKVRTAIAAAEARPQNAPAVPEGWREAIESVLYAMTFNPSCQEGVVPMCACRPCSDHRMRALLAAAPQPAQRRAITDDALLNAFWPHVEVQRTGSIHGIVDALRAVEKLVAPQPDQQLPAVIEDIAQQWDGCTYESASGDIEIGQAIRAAGKGLMSAPQPKGGA